VLPGRPSYDTVTTTDSASVQVMADRTCEGVSGICLLALPAPTTCVRRFRHTDQGIGSSERGRRRGGCDGFETKKLPKINGRSARASVREFQPTMSVVDE
jgi:hypothetical protein